jgi:hypothetical protein
VECPKSTAPLMFHPLLLPILIIDLKTPLTLRDCQQSRAELGALEDIAGQNPMDTSGPGGWQAQTRDTLQLDFGPLMHRLNACTVFMMLI